MSANWKVVPLGEVAEVIGGGTPSRRNAEYYSGDIPWATVKDMNCELLERTELRITADAVASCSTKVIPSGEVVIATRVGLGKVCLLNQDTAINQDLRAIVPRGHGELDRRFLFYWFRSIEKQIKDAGTGATVKGVKLPFVKSLPIPLPPLDEQQRIVEILDEALEGLDRARENTESCVQSSRELFDAVLRSEAKETSALGSYVNIRTGRLNANAAVDEGQYPFFTCSREVSRINTYAFDCEAILLAGNNASGDFNVKHHSGRFNAYQRVYVIEITDESVLDYRYLYWQMVRSLAELKSQSVGAGTKFLRIGMVQNLQIWVPSIDEQRAAAGRLDALREAANRLESSYLKKIQYADSIRESLLEKAFTGELI